MGSGTHFCAPLAAPVLGQDRRLNLHLVSHFCGTAPFPSESHKRSIAAFALKDVLPRGVIMAVTFNLRSSTIGKVGTLASVAHGSDAVIDVDNTTINEMNEGVVERDPTSAQALGSLLRELGIQGDQEKLKAFQELVLALKTSPPQTEAELQEQVKESTIFRLLGKANQVLGPLSSALTIGTALTATLPAILAAL